MTLQLAVKLSLDKGNLAAGAGETVRAIDGIGQAARESTAATTEMVSSVERSSQSVTAAVADQVRAIRSIADAATHSRVAIQRDALGVEIAPSTAAVAARAAEATAATTRLASSLSILRAHFDPLAAATLRYEAELGALREAFRLGAIDGQLLVRAEAELAAAYGRSTAALAARGAAGKAAATRIVDSRTIVPDRGADIAAYGAEMDALRAKYNPLFAAEVRHTATLADIARAERVGALSSDEAAAATSRAKAAHEAEVAALTKGERALAGHAAASKLTAFQAQNLSYQLNDVVVSLASGMNPLTVLMQQGSQIAPIFGGVSGTLRVVQTAMSGTVLGAAALTAGIGLVAKATWDWQAAQRQSATVAAGLGRNLGTSAGEMDRIARASADAGGVSVSSAREMAQAFVSTGRIGTEVFGGLIAISRNFGATIGQDTSSASKTLAELVADPAKGAAALSETYGLIDASTARMVARLTSQNRLIEAQKALVDAVAGRLVDADQTLTRTASQWERIKRQVADVYDQVGRQATIDVVSPDADVLEARKKVAALRDRVARETQGSWTRADDERDLQIQERLLAALEAQAAARRRIADAAMAERAISRGLAIAEASQAPAVQESVARRRLTDEIADLEAGRAEARKKFAADPRETPRLTVAREESTANFDAALEAKTRAQRTWISETLRAQQLAQIDLQIAATRDPIERAELERKRALVTMAGQEIGTSEAAAAANLAYSRSIAEVSAQARGALADTLADVAARTRVAALVAAGVLPLADMNRELQIEAATRQLVAEAAKAEGTEKERLLRLIADTRAAITAQTEAQARQQALQEVASGEDRLRTLRTQIALVGQSEAVQARVLALLEAEQKIRQEGLQGTPEADRLRQQAVEAANLTTELERQKAAWDEIKGVGGDAIDTIVEGLRTGKDVTGSLADSLEKEMLKLAVTNPLKNMLFGAELPTITDVGGVLGNLFGGGDKAKGPALPTSVATATITAGTVVINGGIAGASGLFADSTGGAGSAGSVSRSSLSLVGAANDNGAARIAGAWGLFDGRRAFASELADPAVKSRLFAMTEAEVGGQGPQAQTAFMESVFNRASARGQTLQQTLGANYYAPESISRVASLRNDPLLSAKYDDILKHVQGGSNVSNWATGNASGSVGFGGGPQTAMIAGEKFGIEKPDLAWARLQQSSTQASQSLSSLGTSSTSAVDALGQFQTGAGDATKALTQAGGGIAGAGQTMSTSITSTATTTQSAFSVLTSGLTTGISGLLNGLGSILSGLGGGLGNLFGGIGHLFGFGEGGYTGAIARTSVAGVVHGQEYVVNAAATARHRGLLEAINAGGDVRGYASGGYVGGGVAVSLPRVAAGAPGRADGSTPSPIFQTVIENHTAAQIETRQEDDGRGGKRQVVVIAEAVGRAIAAPRSATQRAMSTAFGLKPAVQRR